ncbi:efflux RND transporter periplasmic adaptor subunit [bacterium]|nr:efflux RND transporter periplasmic adaptor subunit [bacterium]
MRNGKGGVIFLEVDELRTDPRAEVPPASRAAPAPEKLEDALAAHTPSIARWLLPWLLMLCALGCGAVFLYRIATRKVPVAVDVVPVQRGEVEKTVASVSAGRIVARRRSRVAAEVMGRIVNIQKGKGERVQADEVVLELDSSEIDAQLAMARSTADAARAAVSELLAHLDTARREYDRRKRTAPGVVAPEIVERAEREVAALEAGLLTLQARVAEADARIVSIQALLAKFKIRAPFAGVVSELWVEKGEVTSMAGAAGMSKAMASEAGFSRLFEVIDPDDLYITAPIDEADLARVSSGLRARVTLDPYPREPFFGTITRVAPYVLDVEEQNRTVEVEVSIPPVWNGRALKPGTSADVEIVVESKKDVPRLPAHVLIEGKRVLTVEKGELEGELRVVEREVDVGIENWRFAEVRGGIAEGALVVAGAENDVRVKPGQLVTIRKKLDPESR